MDTPRSTALLAFNVGVEVGQLLVVGWRCLSLAPCVVRHGFIASPCQRRARCLVLLGAGWAITRSFAAASAHASTVRDAPTPMHDRPQPARGRALRTQR